MTQDIYRESLELHARKKGKLEICPKVRLKTRRDLALAYTPGVARVCSEIAKNKDLAYKYTIKCNTVAIVTDGSRVLGLGDIGGHAAIPVMEGKAILFKEFAGIDAFPICFEGYHTDFIEDVKNIAPVFGGINLEDIAAPKCFRVEEALQDIGIPVMHDDQHGTAVAVLAALINACRVTGKKFEDITVAVSGAGAAGYGITKLLTCSVTEKALCTKVKDIIVCDTKGTLYRGRHDLPHNHHKNIIAQATNRGNMRGSLKEAIEGADVFIGVSAPGILTEEMVRSMNRDPIVLALANPTPEIMPALAKKAGAAVVGTGRSDFPNQINNVLAFPGIFRGALDASATRITDEMKYAAAHAIATYIKNPAKHRILPSALDRKLARHVAAGVRSAAMKCGVSREV